MVGEAKGLLLQMRSGAVYGAAAQGLRKGGGGVDAAAARCG